eukprot:g44082.t1
MTSFKFFAEDFQKSLVFNFAGSTRQSWLEAPFLQTGLPILCTWSRSSVSCRICMSDQKQTDEGPYVLTSLRDGIATITFNRPRRCNAWSTPMLQSLFQALQDLASKSEVQAVIITGKGKYYCSGVDFGSNMKPARPTTLIKAAEASNRHLFVVFLDFPKPLIVAFNGPAIGACVTSAVLCDIRIANDTATFLTPFGSLGLPAEGCSSFTFPTLFGKERAEQMLKQNKKLSASEAQEWGLVQEVTSGDKLLERAHTLAKEHVAAGRGRYIREKGWLDKLKQVDREIK